METITFTKVRLPYGWLGNMSPFPIMYNNGTVRENYKTAEALFQAMRFPTGSFAQRSIINEPSPMGAKMVAKKWSSLMIVVPTSIEDVNNMRKVLRLKVIQHSLQKNLMKTGDALIVEDVSNRRSSKGNHRFWGAAFVDGEWVGENTLGRLWMELRYALQLGLPIDPY